MSMYCAIITNMKKLIFILLGITGWVLAGTDSVKAETYFIDDAAVEATFNAAVMAPVAADFINHALPNIPAETTAKLSSKNGWVAFALAFIVGGLGIHRFYLGTKTFTGIGYILTCGGIFGVVPFVDWILLLVGAINNDISKYEDNSKFFMW